MKTIDEIRLHRLSLLIEQEGGLTSFCEKYGRNKSQISQWTTKAINTGTKKPRKIGTASCREIEKHFNLQTGWMDLDPDLIVWPFKTIAKSRVINLNKYDLAILEASMDKTLDRIESDNLPGDGAKQTQLAG